MQNNNKKRQLTHGQIYINALLAIAAICLKANENLARILCY